MSRDLLLNRVGDQLNLTGQQRDRAANILLQWIVARLRFDQSIKIEGIGIFQLKKEPLPRVDRKTSPDDAPINKRTLIYAPQQKGMSQNNESVFVSFDLDELNINSSDYLDKVFNLNVDKPLIPVKDSLSQGIDSNEPGEVREDSVEEKIEELVKNGEVLEDINIFERYDSPEDSQQKINELEEDDLLKEELLQSNDRESEEEAESESFQTTDDEIDILDPSILNFEPENEEEDLVVKYDEVDEDDEESDEGDLLDPLAFIEEPASELEEEDSELEKEIKVEDVSDSSKLHDDLREESNAVNKHLDEEKLQADTEAAEDDLNVINEINNLTDDKKDEDGFDDLINEVDAEAEDYNPDEDIIKDTSDLEGIALDKSEEQISVDNEFDITEKSAISDALEDQIDVRKTDFQVEESDSQAKGDDLLEELKISSIMEETPVEKEGLKENDILSQLDNSQNNDPVQENDNVTLTENDLEEPEDLVTLEEMDQELPASKPRSRNKSLKKSGIFFVVISIIAVGLVSVFYFDILNKDIYKELSSFFESESPDESVADMNEAATPDPVDEVTNQPQENQITQTSLYRDIPNDRAITNQIYFDGTNYTVQLSSWKNNAIAEKEVEMLRAKNFDAFIFKVYLDNKKGTWHRVRIGYFNTVKEAEDFLRKNKF